jgi:hypothetical protein
MRPIPDLQREKADVDLGREGPSMTPSLVAARLGSATAKRMPGEQKQAVKQKEN